MGSGCSASQGKVQTKQHISTGVRTWVHARQGGGEGDDITPGSYMHLGEENQTPCWNLNIHEQ